VSGGGDSAAAVTSADVTAAVVGAAVTPDVVAGTPVVGAGVPPSSTEWGKGEDGVPALWFKAAPARSTTAATAARTAAFTQALAGSTAR
jgi:hypothetical protein